VSKKQACHDLFLEMALLCELAGENPFKIRALENGARALTALDGELSDHFAPDRPAEKIAGLGKGLIDKIHEFMATGRIGELDELKNRFPPGLFDMMRVQGLGPKKIKVLYEVLQIDSLAELEEACQTGKVAELKGFGSKTQANILAGIAAVRRFQGQFLHSTARTVADRVVAHLQERHPHHAFVVAGSLRRGKPTVKDIDLLVAAEPTTAPAIMADFVALPGCERVLQHGETKSAVIAAEGIQIDLRVVPPAAFGAALCHFTGSKEHNTTLRGYAKELGKKLNEYGLFTGDQSPPLPHEEDVFAALDLQFIPPELREDLGEIDLARRRTLPALVEADAIVGTLHAHTHRSDGSASAAEMAEAARNHGLRWFGLADHSRTAAYAGGLSIESVRAQWAEIDEYNVQHRGGFLLLKGIESDILTKGALDYPDELLAGFDFVIASVHAQMNQPREVITERVITALANRYTTVFGHPTARILLERDGIDLDMEAVLNACIRHDVAIEINADPHRLDCDWTWLRRFRDTPLKVIIDPDAHNPEGFANLRWGLMIARKGMVRPEQLLNTWPAERFTAWARERRQRPS